MPNVSSGVTSNGVILQYGLMMSVLDGGIANNTTVYEKGEVNVSSGGIANRTTVLSSGSLSLNGGTANQSFIDSWGSFFVGRNGTANETTVYIGQMYVQNGGYASKISLFGQANRDEGDVYIKNGGSVDDLTVGYYGDCYVSSGGIVRRAAINTFGNVEVQGGTVNNVIVSSGGRLTVSKGGIITGNITLQPDALLFVVEKGALINYDLTQVLAGQEALLNNWSLIRGIPDYTITVADGQAAGIYKLASSADEFDSTITVQNVLGESLGTLNLGETIQVGKTGYTLSLNESTLTLTVAGPDTTAPTVSNIQASTTELTNQNIVITAEFADDEGVASALYKLGDNGLWLDYPEGGVTIYENGTVYFKAVDAAGNESEVASYKVENIDKTPPEKPVAAANVTTPTNMDVLVTAKFSADSVVKQYSFDGENWGTYPGGVLVGTNLTVYFRGIDAAGNASEAASYEVTNVDRSAPVITLTGDNQTPANEVLLTAETDDGSVLYYCVDDSGWKQYTEAITVTANGSYSFRATDEAGNTAVSEILFDNIQPEPAAAKWTYLVYMAADNDICYSALYDIVSMQQAKVDSQIDIYVLADRTPAGAAGSGNLETINGTYRWDSDWEDTRVGKITYSPGLTVTVNWTSWGELDTGSIATLKRFVDWAQAESPAENYGLILWDHGGENTELCWDLTTDPKWGACFTVSEVAGLLKEKGNIPLVIFNNCLLGSELVATQLAGSTDVVVVSEPSSYGLSTYNYNMFFRTITPDMTPQEMAALMVRNVEPQSDYTGEPSMLSSIDVTDSRLGDALEALAVAVAAAGNDADKDVLIHAMLQAPQDGSDYDGTDVQQSDLGFLIRDAMADPDYAKTSEGFRKALADVKTALEAVVLEYRSLPAKRGSGIAVCNSVYTAKMLMTSGASPEAAGKSVTSYLTSTYDSNPLWGGLLNDLCATYLAEIEAARIPTAVFSDSEVSGLVDGRTVTVSDLGGFSGRGELFDCIKLSDERFFGFVITAADKSTGSFTMTSDVGAAITVSLLAADGQEVATGAGSVSFQDLAVGTYYLRLQSETDCHVTITSEADWWTGVDRFEGNDSYETAVALDTGYHTGLITCEGDEDYYLIGNDEAPAFMYTVEVYGEEGWTVGEYFPDDEFFYEADYEDGKYTLMMDPMGCLLVEGTADLTNGVDAYSVNVIPYESEWPADITLDDLAGTKDGVSWEPSILMNKYTVEYSTDDFEHTMPLVTTGTAIDTLNLPAGTYQWRVTADSGKNPKWFDGEEIVSDNTPDAPNVFRSSSDANDDLFFATPVGTWSSRYCAKHVGSVGDWTGTGETVSAAGKGRIQDLFFGSADPNTLNLTDSENGDALFLDDIYTGLPEEIEENTARLFRIHEIVAGAGDDIVDMTSQKFEYLGGALSISGGDGDDVIWANRGARNTLFGDAGNDRIVGASGDDVIVGGIGDDSMHGGGGDDIFTFCDNWGEDTVEQLAGGSVTLWFISGSMENWDAETLTYSDGSGNSVTVSGVSADQITLKFEHAGSKLFATLINMGAFAETITKKIFEDTNKSKGILAIRS